MKIPNFDMEDDVVTSYKQLYDFMPDQCYYMTKYICMPKIMNRKKTKISLKHFNQ